MASAPRHAWYTARRGALAAALVALPCGAGPSDPKPPIPPAHETEIAQETAPAREAAPCSFGAGSALTELSCEVARALGPLGDGVTVAVGRATGDRAVSRGSALASRIGASVARALGGSPTVLPSEQSEHAARVAAATSGARVIVHVAPRIQGDTVSLTARAEPVERGFWARARSAAEAPLGRGSARRRVDAEVATFLPAIALEGGRLERLAFPSSDVVAAACGDVDHDGEPELVLVGRRKIQLARLGSGRVSPLAEAAWTGLSAVAPSPLREPIASAVISAALGVDVGITDRASGFHLSETLSATRALDAPIPWGRAGCLARSGVALGRPGPCTRGEVTLDAGDVDGVDAIASAVVRDRNARDHAIVAWRGAGDRVVVLRDDAGRSERGPRTGAALSLGDVDLDGEPDLVTSIDTLNPVEDALVVSSWGTTGGLRERVRVGVPEGVRAIAICPGGATRAAVIAVTAAGLVVLR